MSFKSAAIFAGLAAMSPGIIPIINKEKKEPKNKYNLSDAQIELLNEMTPKEKKSFLKKLSKEIDEAK